MKEKCIVIVSYKGKLLCLNGSSTWSLKTLFMIKNMISDTGDKMQMMFVQVICIHCYSNFILTMIVSNHISSH